MKYLYALLLTLASVFTVGCGCDSCQVIDNCDCVNCNCDNCDCGK